MVMATKFQVMVGHKLWPWSNSLRWHGVCMNASRVVCSCATFDSVVVVSQTIRVSLTVMCLQAAKRTILHRH